jgi:peroxiredoxin
MPERRLLQPGESAPGFRLAAINREGLVSLDAYRGRPLLLGLFRGLHCPFCRRQIAQLSATQDKLKAAGVETLVVVNTPLERARLYFSYRPTRVLLAADPDATTHRAYGAPAFDFIEDEAASRWPARVTMRQFQSVLINPTGEMPSPRDGFEANTVLNNLDRFRLTEADEKIVAAHGTQLAAHFLIDGQGVVRWIHVEAGEGIAGIGKFPTDAELLTAVYGLDRSE